MSKIKAAKRESAVPYSESKNAFLGMGSNVLSRLDDSGFLMFRQLLINVFFSEFPEFLDEEDLAKVEAFRDQNLNVSNNGILRRKSVY
jgi:hypothetical protein